MKSNLTQTIGRLFVFGGHFNKTTCRLLSTSPRQPHVELSTNKALIDEKVRITVNGLKSGQKVTLQAYLTESNKLFGACGHYVADSSGKVDTFKSVSYGGTFEGVEPMGLFWSMKTTPGMKPGRLFKSDVMLPYDITVAVQDGFSEFDRIDWSNRNSSLASCDLQRSYASPGVRKIVVSQDGVYGSLFVPAGSGPFPVLIDIFGITQATSEFRSALLASHGYASFCLSYVGSNSLATDNSDIDFKYFLKAFDWLASHPLVDPSSMGGISTCVGGGFLLLIASLRPAMKCIVSVNNPGVPAGPEQTIEGMHVSPLQFRFERTINIDGMASFLELFQPQDGVTIVPGWQHGAKFLSIQGLDDKCINPKHLDLYRNQIPEKFLPNCTFISYPGAGHYIEPPYSPLTRFNYNAIFKGYLLFGGEAKQHADAQEDSWKKILEFLDNNLRKSEGQRVSSQA